MIDYDAQNKEEFLDLERFVGKKLTCENCECNKYLFGRKCTFDTYNHALLIEPKDIDYEVFLNPYNCTRFWCNSQLAKDFVHQKELRFSKCSKQLSCVESLNNIEIWMKCRFCTEYKE